MANGDVESMIQAAVRGLGGTTGGTADDSLRAALQNAARGLQEDVQAMSSQVETWRRASQAGTEVIRENTEAVLINTAAQVSGGLSGRAAEVARGTLGAVSAGLTLSPLLSGLIGLFRRNKTEQPQLPVDYVKPDALRFVGVAPSEAGGTFSAIDYGTRDVPRVMPWSTQGPVTNVTVQVRAMDSRSFLEHSDEIARAVREAMLNSHALNDVVSEL